MIIHCLEDETQFLELMKKGQLPPRSLLQMSHTKELILSGIKYQLVCTRKGQSSFKIQLLSSDDASYYVMSNVRPLSDGGYLIEIGGQSHNAYVTNKGDAATGMKLNVSGSNIVFSPDYDPTSLRTDVAGKLVKRLVPDGTRVKKGEPYAEIEVMKMFLPLKVEEAGIVEWKMNEGAALSPGDLVATLLLDNPENVDHNYYESWSSTKNRIGGHGQFQSVCQTSSFGPTRCLGGITFLYVRLFGLGKKGSR